jgi:hypothetical protein
MGRELAEAVGGGPEAVSVAGAREQDKMYKKVAGGVGAWHGRWQALGTGEEEGRGV